MALIPQRGDPTIEAIKRIARQHAIDNPQEPRTYLGASIIGNECLRKTWYMYNHAEQEPFRAETLWNFEDGHRVEDIIAARLRLVPGIELWTHDEYGKQYGFNDLDGKFKGHVDGVIRGLLQAPKTLHIWENKSCAEKKWNEFQAAKAKFGEKNTLINWNKEYYAAAQCYMHYFQIDRHYLTIARAGARDIDSCRTEYDGTFAERMKHRAEDIVYAREAPKRISDKPDFYLCRFCNHSKVCHGK